ncbi:hypothetical protein FDK12_13630 [Arthrobacter sp. NamB2]|nr:hypothetical protein FDK12_13630 [Arthrobacter sp. NamB2]
MTQHAFRAARLAAVVIATSMMLGGASGPGADRRAAPPQYVALGDSYASGFGAGSYTGDCGRSPLGLPGILDAEGQLDLVADATCAGAKATSDPGGAVDLPEQVDQVIASGGLGTDTGVVSISVGGNDAGFGEVVACAQAVRRPPAHRPSRPGARRRCRPSAPTSTPCTAPSGQLHRTLPSSSPATPTCSHPASGTISSPWRRSRPSTRARTRSTRSSGPGPKPMASSSWTWWHPSRTTVSAPPTPGSLSAWKRATTCIPLPMATGTGTTPRSGAPWTFRSFDAR